MSFITLRDLGQASGVCAQPTGNQAWVLFTNEMDNIRQQAADGRLAADGVTPLARKNLTSPGGSAYFFRNQLDPNDLCMADKLIAQMQQAVGGSGFFGSQDQAQLQANAAQRNAVESAVAADPAAQARNAADEAADPNAPGAGAGVVGGTVVSTVVTDSPAAMSLAAKLQGAKDVLSGKVDCATLKAQAPDMAFICDVKKYAKYIGIAAAVGVGIYLFGPAIRGGSKVIGRRMNRRRKH